MCAVSLCSFLLLGYAFFRNETKIICLKFYAQQRSFQKQHYSSVFRAIVK